MEGGGVSRYNEIDSYAASWLRNLVNADLIAGGEVDERSIEDLEPSDLTGTRQFHAFAGIGAWSYALRLAGVPDDAAVWTGSCPCQPFSIAGRGRGTDDPRHLWPAWFRLIRECRPPVVFGEQVASPAGRAWLDAVSADLEEVGYAVGAADLCAAGVGAPHIRQRLYFVAYALPTERPEGWTGTGRRSATRSGGDGRVVFAESLRPERGEEAGREAGHRPQLGGEARLVGHADAARLPLGPGTEDGRGSVRDEGPTTTATSSARRVGEPDRSRSLPRGEAAETMGYGGPVDPAGGRGATCGPWHPADWLPCRDGKLRPVEPGTFPLAHGAPARVGRLRAYGNAIVPQVAAAFVRAAIHPEPSTQDREEP